MTTCSIAARDLNDLYFQVLNTLLLDALLVNNISIRGAYTYKQKIDKGSFEEGGERIQFESLSLCVDHPEVRPLAPIFPSGFSPTTSDENIEKYFATYIMNEVPDKKSKEDYIYGTFIYPHLPRICSLLINTPNTNHAVVNVGESFEVYDYPPCLRCIHWMVIDGKLNIYLYWRSWDLFAGMPENLGGLQLLNEYVAMEIGIETGKMFAYSSGAHIYSYQIPIIKGYLRV